MASRTSSSTCIGKVNSTADSWVRTRFAIGRASLAWTRLPGSTRRTSMRVARRPDRGEIELRLRGFHRHLGLERGLELVDPRLLLVDGLLGGDASRHQRHGALHVLFGRPERRHVLSSNDGFGAVSKRCRRRPKALLPWRAIPGENTAPDRDILGRANLYQRSERRLPGKQCRDL
jgi:hypothetical protein